MAIWLDVGVWLDVGIRLDVGVLTCRKCGEVSEHDESAEVALFTRFEGLSDKLVTIDDLRKSRREVESTLHTFKEYGADASLHRLIVTLCDFDTDTRKRIDSGEQKTSTISKTMSQKLELQEDTLKTIKTVLEQQKEAISDLTIQMTLLEGAALEVCEPVV